MNKRLLFLTLSLIAKISSPIEKLDVDEKIKDKLLDDITDIINDTMRENVYCVEIPCKVGDTVYKICPKCSDKHNGSCKNCAWSGCLRNSACDIGVRVYQDGSFTNHELQIVEKTVYGNNISGIYDLWNIQYFATPEDAEKAKNEYEVIRNIDDYTERYAEYCKWELSRKIINPLKSGNCGGKENG